MTEGHPQREYRESATPANVLPVDRRPPDSCGYMPGISRVVEALDEARSCQPTTQSVWRLCERSRLIIALFRLIWNVQVRKHYFILSTNLSSVPPGDAGRGKWVLEICRPSHFRGRKCDSALHNPGVKSGSSSGQRASNNLNITMRQTLLILYLASVLFQRWYIVLILPKQ